MSDTIEGSILHIPEEALNKITQAEGQIKSLENTSRIAARKIKGHFDNTAVSGLNAFIDAIRRAKRELRDFSMPTFDGAATARGLSEIAAAIGTMDRSATTGANRLGRIADAITRLHGASPDPALFETVARGIERIGATSDATIARVSALASTMASLARDIRTVSAAMAADDKGYAKASQYNKLYNEQATIIRNILELNRKGGDLTVSELNQLTALKNRYSEISAQLDILNRKKQTAASTLASITGQNNLQRAVDRSSAKGAIDFAKSARSVNELETAIKNLKSVMATLNPKSKEWNALNKVLGEAKQKLDGIKQSMADFNGQAKRASDSAGELGRRIATVFSIGAISGFLQKMTQVYAQFELQKTALRAIIQNKREADEVFAKVQQMALQSPFTIMQLTTYTKQLAAYRIEANKLVGTTKMLADVSAGLGVSMDRLILAYGQVKAANYLRATEVRQFTEAGLNIAGELAQYFSELQGKMISVGDVMEMITKRMVKFEDVEEVFKRVTSAGGLFYDMQKKQSGTTYGQIQRISDAWSIMLNDIGKSESGIINWVLRLIREMIKNWRYLVAAIRPVLLAIAAYKSALIAVSLINSKFAKNLVFIIKNLREFRTAMSLVATSASTMVASILGAIGALAGLIWSISSAKDSLSLDLGLIGKEVQKDLNESIEHFEDYVRTINSATASEEERNKAYEQLQREYANILPKYMLEIEYLKNLGDNYDQVNSKLREYYQLQKMQRQNDAFFSSEQWNKVMGETERSAKLLYDFIKGQVKTSASELGAVMQRVVTQWAESGKVFKDQTELVQTLRKEIESFYNIKIDDWVIEHLQNLGGQADLGDIWDEFEKIQDKRAIIGEGLIGTTQAETKEAKRQFDMQQKVNKAFEEASPKIEQYNKDLKELQKTLKKLGFNLGEDDIDTDGLEELKEKAQGAADSIYGIQDALNNLKFEQLEQLFSTEFEWGGWFDDTDSRVRNMIDVYNEMAKIDPTKATGYLAQIEQYVSEHSSRITQATKDTLQREQDAVEEREAVYLDDRAAREKQAKYAEKAMDKMTDDQKAYLRATQLFTLQEGETRSDQLKRMQSEYKNNAEFLEAYNRAKVAGFAEAFLAIRGLTQEEIDLMKVETEGMKNYLTMAGIKLDKTSRKDPEIERWKKRISAMKEYFTELEKAEKKMSGDKIAKTMKDSFKTLWEDTGLERFVKLDEILAMGFDPKTLEGNFTDALEMLKSKVPPQYVEIIKEIQAEISKHSVKVDFKVQEEAKEKLVKEMETILKNFELTKELSDMGLNIDLTFMLGGQPIENLDILREKIKAAYDVAIAEGQLGTDAVKEYEKMLKKINELEAKDQKDRLKKYQKYLGKMYSDRAKAMIDSYTLQYQMEKDFQKNIQQLETELAAEGTPEARKEEINKLIETLRTQLSEATLGIQNELQQAMAKADWENFKGSDIFTSMYQDLDTLSKKGIDALILRLETLRDKLQSMDNVDFKAVREITGYIEKLKDTKIELAPYSGFKTAIAAAKELKKEYGSLENAQLKLIELNDSALNQEQFIADLETLIALENNKVSLTQLDAETTARLESMADEYGSDLQGELESRRQILATNKKDSSELEAKIAAAQKVGAAYQAQINNLKKIQNSVQSITDTIFDMADALGASVDDEWKTLASSLIDATFQAITLQMQIKMLEAEAEILGAKMNMALSIIGWIATALQVVASLLMAIFAAHDKSLQKQIEKLEDQVDALDKAFQKLQKSIERAFTVSNENKFTKQALDNLEKQKNAYQQMIRLEEEKKKTDDDKIKEYRDKIEELDEAMQELYETRHEKWGSTDDAWNEANSWIDAWANAFKETGDGLDALDESWDDFYENLVKKQAVSKILGSRMDKYIQEINDAIDKNMDEMSYVDAFREIGDRFKKEFGDINQQLIDFFKYAGIGAGGDLILSDLQKGIQNITEPQAAAIEAYLNSMRFAVYRHTEQFDELLATIRSQYSEQSSTLTTYVKEIRDMFNDFWGRFSQVTEVVTGRGWCLKVN